jgi:hypothetical protein
VRQNLFKVLHQYLPYRSLLRSVAKALQRVDRLNLTADTVGPLWDAWQQFHRAAMTKLVFKDEFDRMYPPAVRTAMIGCMNPKVKRLLTLYSTPPLTCLVHSACGQMPRSFGVARLAL